LYSQILRGAPLRFKKGGTMGRLNRHWVFLIGAAVILLALLGMIAEGLSVPKRVLLFCLASANGLARAGVTHAAVCGAA
jgi:hypothetical protein